MSFFGSAQDKGNLKKKAGLGQIFVITYWAMSNSCDHGPPAPLSMGISDTYGLPSSSSRDSGYNLSSRIAGGFLSSSQQEVGRLGTPFNSLII